MKAKAKSKAVPKTIDEYLAPLSGDQRAALERLRRIIKTAVPGAEECISYRLPAFRHDGKMLVWFGAAAKHCSLYPGPVLAEFEDELRGYDTSKGTLRFQPGQPLPATLVRKLVKARIKSNAATARRPTRGVALSR